MQRIRDDFPVKDLEWPRKLVNCLSYADITLVGQLRRRTDDQLLRISGFGRKSLPWVRELAAYEPDHPPSVAEQLLAMAKYIEKLEDSIASQASEIVRLTELHDRTHAMCIRELFEMRRDMASKGIPTKSFLFQNSTGWKEPASTPHADQLTEDIR